MNKYLVLSTPRSGTHFLSSSIEEHFSNIIAIDEIIHEKRAGVFDRLSAMKSLEDELDKSNSISIIHMYQVLLWNIDIDFFSKIINKNNIKIFLLIRKNNLEKFLSLKLAEENKIYHTNDQNYIHSKKIIFKKEDFINFENEQILYNKLLFKLASLILDVQVIYYEDLLNFGGFFINNNFIKISNNKFKKIIDKNNLKDYLIFESSEDENFFDNKILKFNKFHSC